MNSNKLPTQGLYAITDCEKNSYFDILEKTEKILGAGAAILQYRNKTTDFESKKILARELKLLCDNFNAIFIINDDVTLAKEVYADGVHLGESDEKIDVVRKLLGDVIIGKSCYNNIDSAIKAEKEGADYVAFGSFFHSQTKPNARNAKLDIIIEAKSSLKLPVVAIGGITPENGKTLIDAGADFLGVVSGLYNTKNTINNANAYLNLFRQ